MNASFRMLSLAAAGALAALGLAGVMSAAQPAHAAQSMPYDLDPGLAAKLAKEKVKQRGPRRRSADYGTRNSGSNAGDDACGQLEIGNSNNNGRMTAAERFRERNRTVIVTGPVINAANCR